jgi:glyoxylate/hydroxypyruvate reductase A
LSKDRTVGILGVGQLGSDVARVLMSMGFKVRGWKRHPPHTSHGSHSNFELYHGKENLNSFLAQSEILVNLLPLTAETEGILDADTLRQLPKGAFLINVARGRHVVDKDLLALLDSGHIAGATLDVFWTEPLPVDHPFWTHPKVIVTPHAAALTIVPGSAKEICDQICAHVSGEALKNIVDRNRGY